jgi:hypothetical protein
MAYKAYGINFGIGHSLQTTLQLENLVANYLQLKGLFHIFYPHFDSYKLYNLTTN